jgi:autotransporter-associated beta strand protein
VGDVSITTTAITGSGPTTSYLNKDGAGVLLLSTTNTYAGTTSITSGIVRISNADAFGLAAAATTIISGAALEINAATTLTIPEPITINGTGVTNTGAIRLLSSSLAAATLSGTITVASASRINTDITSGTNTLTIAGGITASANLSLGTTSAGGIIVSSVIGGTGGGIEKDGTGTGKLLLTTANTYTGATSITYGIIQIQNNTSLGSTTGVTTISGSNAALEINGSIALSIPESITINGTGLSNTGAIRLITGASAATLTGTITVASASRINTDVTTGTNTLTISGGITNTNGLTLGINDAAGITISGAISGITATSYITKDGTGAGKLILSGTNTYAGTTSITSGVVQIQNKDALGVATLGTIIGSTNAALEISGGSLSIPEGITISGTGLSGTPGAIRNILGTNAISGTISLTGNARINVDAGTLSLTSTGTSLSLVANALNAGVASGTSMYISGAITGSGIFTKDSTGTLYVSGNNTTTGAIEIYKGVLNIQGNANALGSNLGSTTIYSGAALQVQGGVTFADEPIYITGTGINSDGAIRNITGSNTLPGIISLTGAARINVDAGTLSLTRSIALSTNSLTAGVASGTSMYVSAALTGNGALTSDNTGTLFLSGTSSTYDGVVNVSSGVVNVQSNSGLGSATGKTIVSSTATLQVQNSITSPEPIDIGGLGISSLGAIRSISGNNILTGAISLTGNARINVDAGSLSMTTGTIALGTNSLNTGVYSGTNMYLSGLLTGETNSTLTKDNTGSLFLSGNNTNYNGAIIVSTGTLNAQSNYALGAISGATTISSGATMQVSGSGLDIPEPITINGDGIATSQGALRNPSGNNTWSGAISLGSDARIVTTGSANTDSLVIITGGISTGSYTLTADASRGMRVGGVITGTGGLLKVGNDTLVLNSSNNYSGTTTVNYGVISLRNVNGLVATGAATTINTGAAVNF